ncbi:hypothetical protein GN956_G3110 [Arapaima gigas]
MSRSSIRRPKCQMWSFRKNPIGTAKRRRRLKPTMVKPADQKYRRADARPDRFVSCYRKAEGAGRGVPSGIRAPENTTQYLMNIVYQDMVSDGELPFLAETLEEMDSDVLYPGRSLRTGENALFSESAHTSRERDSERPLSPWSALTSEQRDSERTLTLESALTSEQRDSERTLTPESALTSEERVYAVSLAFQQRDFELMCGLCGLGFTVGFSCPTATRLVLPACLPACRGALRSASRRPRYGPLLVAAQPCLCHMVAPVGAHLAADPRPPHTGNFFGPALSVLHASQVG